MGFEVSGSVAYCAWCSRNVCTEQSVKRERKFLQRVPRRSAEQKISFPRHKQKKFWDQFFRI